MAILCPRCGREFDVTLFSFGSTVRCDCGAEVSLTPGHRTAGRSGAVRDPRRGMEEIARGSERIVTMILCADCPEVDVAIAVERLRERAEELFPGREDFFRMVYEARFDRLMAQWRR